MDGTETTKTVIADDVEVTGSIKCSSNIQLDGKLNGDLNCSGNVVVGNSAVIKGNISADSTTVMGQINGNITAKDRIELKSSARLTGDIRAKRLSVEDGVTFVGKSEVNPSGTAAGRAAAVTETVEDPSADSADDDDARGKGGMFGKK